MKAKSVFIYDKNLNQIDKLETQKEYDLKWKNPILRAIAKNYSISYGLIFKAIRDCFAICSNELNEMVYISLLDTKQFQQSKMYETERNKKKQYEMTCKSNQTNKHFEYISHHINNEGKKQKTIGIVKFYDTRKEYGFITVSGENIDVFFHKRELKQTVENGDRIEFIICNSKTGLYATEIMKLNTNIRIDLLNKRDNQW